MFELVPGYPKLGEGHEIGGLKLVAKVTVYGPTYFCLDSLADNGRLALRIL